MDKLMDKILKKISVDVDSIRVVKEKVDNIEVPTSFVGLKKGEFTLNNGSTIIREGVYKKMVAEMLFAFLQ